MIWFITSGHIYSLISLLFTQISPNQNSYSWVKAFWFLKVCIKFQITEILRKLKSISFAVLHYVNIPFLSVLERAKNKLALSTDYIFYFNVYKNFHFFNILKMTHLTAYSDV